MAYSTQRSVSDGTLQLLMISIEFFDKSEISVYFDNIPTSAYIWATDKSLRFNDPVPQGVEVLIRRTTDLSEVRHVFSRGAQFKDSTLDDDFRQILHISQEAVEGANVGDIYSTLNMHGNSITNVGPAVADGDAISLGQVRTESLGAWAATSQAQAAKVAAEAAATAAAGSQASATASANAASGSAASAAAQVGLAATQAGNSAASAALSDTARAAAVVAQNAASASSTLSQKWAAELEDVVVAGGLYSSYHYSRKAAASAVAAAASAAEAAIGTTLKKNMLINGAGRINQRGYVSGTATTAAAQYTLDRWKVVVSGQSLVFATNAPGNVMTAPAGGVEQIVEGTANLGGVHTLSWTGTATATVNGVAITNGGQTASLTAGTNITVRFTGGTFQFTKLERGNVASVFEAGTYAEQLLACQHYGYALTSTVAGRSVCSVAFVYSTNIAVGTFRFPTTMRTNPTVAFLAGNPASFSITGGGGGGILLDNLQVLTIGTETCTLGAVVSTAFAMGYGTILSITSNPILFFSAEL